MKIGILTQPLRTNYGGLLQAYALQIILQRMGNDVSVIEQKINFKLSICKRPLVYGKRLLRKYLLNDRSVVVFSERKLNAEYPIISQYTQQFIERYIVRKVTISNYDFSKIPINKFDAIVVGSDQIWRPLYYRKIRHAYLDFAKKWNIKRISYAASFGTDNWEYTYSQTKRCKKLLAKFDAVSVREKSGVNLCRKYLNRKAIHVLDPTMLLAMDDYIKLINSFSTTENEGNLLIYILDRTNEKDKLIEKIATYYKYTPFRVNSLTEKDTKELQERIAPPVEQWLKGFTDAKFVVTDSFHACVFSILFHKPFIVYGNKRRGMSRFHSLLSLFTLEDRLITSYDELTEVKMSCAIDWNKIDVILENRRKDSLHFLFDALEK